MCFLDYSDMLFLTLILQESSSYCSLVEKTKNGTQAITTPQGNKRLYVEDGDEVNFTAWAGGNPEGGVGFGECKGLILPARICAQITAKYIRSFNIKNAQCITSGANKVVD